MYIYPESYQYIITINGVKAAVSKSFDSPWAVVNDFFEFAREHYSDETFKKTDLSDGGLCFVNEQPTHKRFGHEMRIDIEARFYKMVAEPMTCTSFVDNMLATVKI